MTRLILISCSLALMASPAESKRPPPVTFTRAEVAKLGTAELARRLLPPEQAAAALSHVIEPPFQPGLHLTVVEFALAPRPIGEDICAKDKASVYFFPPGKRRAPKPPDAPAQIIERGLSTRIALAPGCRTAPGQQFARILGMPDEKAIELLRTLNAARAAAAAPGPLRFRLSCQDQQGEAVDMCGADPRATLASLPLTQAFDIRRSDFVAGAFTVVVGDPKGYDEDVPFWEIDIIRPGTPEAEVRMAWKTRTLI